MKGIPGEVAENSLQINPRSKPVKQWLCCFDEEKHKATEEETNKILVAGFI